VRWTRSRRVVLFGSSISLTLASLAGVPAALATKRSMMKLEIASGDAQRRASWLPERSTELDPFAGRVAHDILSPLMVVGAALQVCRARLPGDAVAAVSLQRAERSLLRVREIVVGYSDGASAIHLRTLLSYRRQRRARRGPRPRHGEEARGCARGQSAAAPRPARAASSGSIFRASTSMSSGAWTGEPRGAWTRESQARVTVRGNQAPARHQANPDESDRKPRRGLALLALRH
jgi:hypothetical protein